ncbi:MAG: hypothetical protein IPQ09_11805 [Myxococcales bacterium]|nr:hypothetical protein [Myxococcales bacterium]
MIFAATLFFAIHLVFQNRAVIRELKRATATVSKVDRATFGLHFERVSAELGKSPLLKHAWMEFLETLVRRELWPTGEVSNTAQPGEYFDLARLQEGHVSRRFHSSLPNLLVGFGLGVTFLGLAAGISLASGKLNLGDISALKSLLDGAFLSFGKSAAAIFCSLVFGRVDDWYQSKAEAALGELTKALEERLTLVTPERLALEQNAQTRELIDTLLKQTASLDAFAAQSATLLAQITTELRDQRMHGEDQAKDASRHHARMEAHAAEETRQARARLDVAAKNLDGTREQTRELSEQTTQLKHFNTDFANSVSGALETALERRISERLGPMLQAVIAELGGIRSERSSSNEKALQGLVSQFQSTLTGAAGSEMAGMAQTLSDLRGSLAEASAAMSEAHERASATSARMTTDAATTLTKTQEALGTQTAALSELIRTIATESGSSVTAVIERATAGMAKVLESSGASSATATAQMTELVAGMREAMNSQLATVTEMIHQASSTSQGAVRAHLTAAGDELARGTQQQTAALEASAAALTRATDTWASLIRGSEQLVERAGTTVQSFDSTGTQLTAISANLARTASSMDGAQAHLAVHAEATARSAAAMSAATKAIDESLQHARASWGEYERRFTGVDASLAQTFKSLDEGLASYAARVKEYLSEVDRSLGEAVNQLSSAISPLGEDLEALPDQVKRFADAVDRLGGGLQGGARR